MINLSANFTSNLIIKKYILKITYFDINFKIHNEIPYDSIMLKETLYNHQIKFTRLAVKSARDTISYTIFIHIFKSPSLHIVLNNNHRCLFTPFLKFIDKLYRNIYFSNVILFYNPDMNINKVERVHFFMVLNFEYNNLSMVS